jgi:hypothetical protein
MDMTTTTTAPADRDLDLEEIAGRYFAAWEARDPDRIAALHSEDTRFHLHVSPDAAVGRDAVHEAFAGIFALYPDFSFVTHRVLYGPRHWTLDWTMIAGDIRLHMFDIVEVTDDGLVRDKQTYVDVDQFNALVARLEAR